MSGEARPSGLESISRDDDTGMYTARLATGGDCRPSVAVPVVVAVATGQALEDLPPLYDRIDPDALDALFADRPTGDRRPNGHIAFPYSEVEVTLVADGVIQVRNRDPVDADDEP